MKISKQRLKDIITEELQEEKLNESWKTEKVPYSSKEAKTIIEDKTNILFL